MNPTNYHVILQQNRAVLVEWRDEHDQLQRSILPTDVMSGTPEKELEKVLAEGIPFGVAWHLMLCEPLALRLANQLHEHGFWTYIDATRRVREFRNVIMEVIAASLLDAARGEAIQ